MNDRVRRRHDLFKRVLLFWEDPAQPQRQLIPESRGRLALNGLQAIVSALETADARRAEGAGEKSGSTTAKAVLADSLRLDLQNINRTARIIAEDDPGFDGPLGLPASASYSALETATRAHLAVLQAPGVADRFIAHDLPIDFVEDLTADLKSFSDADDDQANALEQQIVSNAATSRLLAEGMKHLRALDAVAHNRFTRRPDDLRAWQSASHLERSPQRPENDPPAPAGGNGNGTPTSVPPKA